MCGCLMLSIDALVTWFALENQNEYILAWQRGGVGGGGGEEGLEAEKEGMINGERSRESE